MTQPRTYRKVHPSNESQAAKAARDYAKGSCENRNAVGSVLYEEYQAAYFDLVAAEEIESHNEGH
jgi:hypothetical protein